MCSALVVCIHVIYGSVVMCLSCFFFFFKQKTAYEMRISDWSSDVCSSDLINARGVPVLAVGVSALVTLLCVAVNYLFPQGALELLMSLAVAALVINWAMISLAHLKFRRAMQRQGVEPSFKAFWFTLTTYLCLAFVSGILEIGRASGRERVCQYV